MLFLFVGILVILVFILGRYYSKRYRVQQWRNALNLNQHEKVFQTLYKDVDGFALSQASRLHTDALEYTYGEIDFPAFIALLSLTKPSRATRFYDLGSGTGKAVLACAMVFDVEYSCGIELFQLLHDTAVKQQERLREFSEYTEMASKIRFIHDDFLNQSWEDATLIFINSTALIGPTWERLNEKFLDQAIHATVITTSKPLSSPGFEIIRVVPVQMSWGVVHAYIQTPKIE